MCDQTEIHYSDGDIVWVKLGSCWWPGQVIDLKNLPEEIELGLKRKPPIAVVKFFQEDSFEFVKNYHLIYKYNCTRKDDFIKKGLEKLRTKTKIGSNFLEKFPDDIKMAEILTDGDPNILLSSKFSPQEKPDISGLFGEKKVLKKKRSSEERDKKNLNGCKRSVTHPRFLRGNDHEIRIRPQPINRISTPNNPLTRVFPCHLCKFTATRVNVIICHLKSHRLSNESQLKQKIKTKKLKPAPSVKLDSRKNISQKEKSFKKFASERKEQKKSASKHEKLLKTHEEITTKSDAKLKEKLLADWNEDSDESIESDKILKNHSDDNLTFSFKPKSNVQGCLELQEPNQSNIDTTDFVLESNKILEETKKIIRFTDLDVGCLKTNIKSVKSSKNEEENLIMKKTPFLVKSLNSKNDDEARLSCFDFNEDDLAEPKLSPDKKIPRNPTNKNFFSKKDTVQKIEQNQAIKKNDIDSATGELDTTLIDDDKETEREETVGYEIKNRETCKVPISADQLNFDSINYKKPVSESPNHTIEILNNEKAVLSGDVSSAIDKNFRRNIETGIESEISIKTTQKNKETGFFNEGQTGRYGPPETFKNDKNNIQDELSNLKIESTLSKNQQNEFSGLDNFSSVPDISSQSYIYENRSNSFDSNLLFTTRKRHLQLEDDESGLNNAPEFVTETDNFKQITSPSSKDLSASGHCRVSKKKKENETSELALNFENVELQKSCVTLINTEQLAEKTDNLAEVDMLEDFNTIKNESIVSIIRNVDELTTTKKHTSDYQTENSLKQSTCQNFKEDETVMEQSMTEGRCYLGNELLNSKSLPQSECDFVKKNNSENVNIEMSKKTSQICSTKCKEVITKTVTNNIQDCLKLKNNATTCKIATSGNSDTQENIFKVQDLEKNLIDKCEAANKSLYSDKSDFTEKKSSEKLSKNSTYVIQKQLFETEVISSKSFNITARQEMTKHQYVEGKTVKMNPICIPAGYETSKKSNEPCEIFPAYEIEEDLNKKKDKPRIIQNVTLKEPMILKKKIYDKTCKKFVKYPASNVKILKSTTFLRAKILSNSVEKSNLEITSCGPNEKEKQVEKITCESNNKYNTPYFDSNVSKTKNDISEQPMNSINIDIDLDINSMPYILNKDIFTPESIDKMPVLISPVLPSTDLIDTKTKVPNTKNKILDRKTEVHSASADQKRKNLNVLTNISKNTIKSKPMITSIQTIVPPLNSNLLKNTHKINSKTFKKLDKSNKKCSNYVIVQASGISSLHSKHQIENKIATSKSSSTNAQIVQQDGKVVILTPTHQSSLLSINKNKLTNNNISSTNLCTNTQATVDLVETQQMSSALVDSLTPVIEKTKNPNISETFLEVYEKQSFADNETLNFVNLNRPTETTSKTITFKKHQLAEPLSHFVTTNNFSGNPKSIRITSASKDIISTNKPLKNSSQKMFISPITKSFSTTTILTSQGIISKSPVLTPITGSQVKALAAKNVKIRKSLVQCKNLQNKNKICKDRNSSLLNRSSTEKVSLTISQSNAKEEECLLTATTPSNWTLPKEVKSLLSDSTIIESKKISKSETESNLFLADLKQKNLSKTNDYSDRSIQKKDLGTSKSFHLLKGDSTSAKYNHMKTFPEKNNLRDDLQFFDTVENSSEIKDSLDSKIFDANTTEEHLSKSILKNRLKTSTQLLALPANTTDETPTYVIVSVNADGHVIPLDNRDLASFAEKVPHADQHQKHSNSNESSETNFSDNIVLEVVGDHCIKPASETVTNIEFAEISPPEKSSFSSNMVQTRSCEQDILAAALANTDFQNEISAAGSVEIDPVSNFSQTNLINQTIMQSTIIPTKEPITSALVLETSSTLNQPIMTPIEVPSNLSLQSKLSNSCNNMEENSSKLLRTPNVQQSSLQLIENKNNSKTGIEKISKTIINKISPVKKVDVQSTLDFIGNLKKIEPNEVASSCSISLTEKIDYKPSLNTLSMPILDDTSSENVMDSKKIIIGSVYNKQDDMQISSPKLFEMSKDVDDLFQQQEQFENLHDITSISKEKNKIEKIKSVKDITDIKAINEDTSSISSKLVEKSFQNFSGLYAAVTESLIEKVESDQILLCKSFDSSVPSNNDSLELKKQSLCQPQLNTSIGMDDCSSFEKSCTETFANDALNVGNLEEYNALTAMRSSEKTIEEREQKLPNLESADKFSLISKTCTTSVEPFFKSFNVNTVTKQESHIRTESDETEIESISMTATALNHSAFSEDDAAITSYVPETPENQERDQDQESAISTSSYEIPPCDELNFNNSDIMTDTTSIHSNGVLEVSNVAFELSPESNTISSESVQTPSYANQSSVDRVVSPSFEGSAKNLNEVPVQHKKCDLNTRTTSPLETCSQTYIEKDSMDFKEDINLYSRHSKSVDPFCDNSTSHTGPLSKTAENKTEKSTNCYKNSLTSIALEHSQNLVEVISHFEVKDHTSYNDSNLIIKDDEKPSHSESVHSVVDSISQSASYLSTYEDKDLPILNSEDLTFNTRIGHDCSPSADFMNR